MNEETKTGFGQGVTTPTNFGKQGDLSISNSSSELDLTDKRSSGFTSDMDSDAYTQSLQAQSHDGSHGVPPHMGKLVSKESRITKNSGQKSNGKRGRRSSRKQDAPIDLGKEFLEAPPSARGYGRSPRKQSPRTAANKDFEKTIDIMPPSPRGGDRQNTLSQNKPPTSPELAMKGSPNNAKSATQPQSLSPIEKKTIQFKEDLYEEPLVIASQVQKMTGTTRSPPSIMKKAVSEMTKISSLHMMSRQSSTVSKASIAPPTIELPQLFTKLPPKVASPKIQDLKTATIPEPIKEVKRISLDCVKVEGVESLDSSDFSPEKVMKIALNDVLENIDEHVEDRSLTDDQIVSEESNSTFRSSSSLDVPSAHSYKNSEVPPMKVRNSVQELVHYHRELRSIESGSSPSDATGGLMTKLQPAGIGLRRMQTQRPKAPTNFSLQPKTKISGVSNNSKGNQSHNREVSFKAKSRLNSRYGGRSEKSYLTFAPKVSVAPELDEYNLKVNEVDEQAIQDALEATQTRSKHIYSKENFATFGSMKSVLKPRMIHLIKQGRQQAKEDVEALDSSSVDHLSNNSLSEPVTSDSDSVYSNVRSNYLETNESQSIDMRLEKDVYHMKKNFKEDATNIFQPNMIPQRSSITKHISSSLNILSDDDSKQNSRQSNRQSQPSNKHRRKLSGQQQPAKQTGLNQFQKGINGGAISDYQDNKSIKSVKQKKKILAKKRQDSLKDKKKIPPTLSIRDDFSISDDDDNNNMIHPLTFLYYFPSKIYFICHGRKIYGYTPNSFNKLGYDNIIRQLAIWISEWPWFDRIIIFLIVVNSLGLGMLDYEYTNLTTDFPELGLEMPFLNRLMEQTEFFFTICFTMEMLIKMIASGLILDKNCYLRDYWNWLDFIVVLGSILAYLPNFSNVTILRTFRLFKPLRSLRTLPSMQELVVTLLDSVMQLTNVFFLLVFALLVFSILGVQIWRGVTHYKCRTTLEPVSGIWQIAEDNTDVCGGLNVCNTEAGQVCGSLRDPQWAELLEGHEVNLNSGSDYDLINFDNIFKATISMFQVATLEGWYNLMIMMMNGYNKYITMIFFVSAIQICHYLLFNMTLAVMICNLRKQKEDDFNQLIDRQVDLQRQISKRRRALNISNKDTKDTCLSYARICLSRIIKVSNDEREPPERRYNSNFIVCVWRMTTHITYKTFFLAIVITNVVILATDYHQERTVDYLERKNRDSHILVISTLAFNIDTILKLCAFELKAFCNDRLNMMDAFLCIVFTGLFLVDQLNTGHFSLEYEDLYYSNKYAFLEALRLLRLIVFARALQTISVLLDCIAFTFDSVGNFLVLLFIFLYVFSLLGMQCFAGKLIFDAKGNKITELTDISQIQVQYIPRSNFDDIGKSFVTVFQILIGELWNEVFLNCWKGSGPLIASGYFITLIFFGNIMMLNLFLAMLLGNFERASLISAVSNEQSKLAQLMPIGSADLLAQLDKPSEEGQVVKAKSILRPSTNFKEIEEADSTQNGAKRRQLPRIKRQARLGGAYQRKDSYATLSGENAQNKDVDSSYDSQQSLQKVRRRYQNQKLDSNRARIDRRVSFAAYAFDPYFNVPAEDEKGTDFQLNHFYDEPSPDLFNDSQPSNGVENDVGVKRRLRSMSVLSCPSPTAGGQKSKSFSGGMRNTKDIVNFTGALAASLAPQRGSSIHLQVPEVNANQEQSDSDRNILLRSGIVKPPSPKTAFQKARPPRPLPISIPAGEKHPVTDELPKIKITKVSAIGESPSITQKKEKIGAQQQQPVSLLDSSHFNKDLILRAMAYSKKSTLTINTGENPRRVQDVLAARRAMTDQELQGRPSKSTFGERCGSCWEYMRKSSLFCFHKRSKFRKRLIRVATGGITKPLFKTVDELVDFYTQKIQKNDETNSVGLGAGAGHQPSTAANDEDYESSDESIKNDYGTKTDSQKFIEDHNSSFYIDEVLQVQQSKNFSYQNLRDQLSTIRIMQESGRYDIFVGNTLKNKGSFYLTENHDIKITFPKWYMCRTHTIFIQVMNLAVIVSSLTLAFDNPFDDPTSLRQQILSTIDIVLTVLFTLEAMVKIVAMGFFKGSLSGKKRKAYIQDPNNVLDFFLVLIQIFYTFRKQTLSPSQTHLTHGLKALKALRGLRPLRMISRFKGLRIAMNTILNSGQQIFNIVALALIVIIIFAVCFEQIFKGTFYRCVIDGNPDMALYDDRIDTKQDCLDLGYTWENPQEHFDDLVNTILNLMIFMTNENWVTVMYRAVDSRGVDLQPKRNSNIQNIIVFIVYMVVSHVFILNLFVGVIIQRFNSNNEVVQGYKGNKINARKWIDIQRLMMKQRLQPKWYIPDGGVQRFFALICLSKPFDPFIYFTIVCNLVVLAMPYDGMSKTYSNILDQCSFTFSVIYNVEAFIKLMGLRMRYFHEKWNIMDLFIVILSDIGSILATYTTVGFTTLMPVIRALRVARILKLIKGSSGLKVIVKALITLSLNLINILGLLILLVFICAVLGMNIFHGVMYQEHYNENANFRTFDNSLILLIRCITGEGWDLIMQDLGLAGESYDGTQCVSDQTIDGWNTDGILGCGFKFTYIFFFVFVVLSQMVFINLFIAFVLQAYMTNYDENFSLITLEDYDKLTTLWADYDPKATGMIEPQDIAFMLHELDGQLGRSEEYQELIKIIQERNENEASEGKSVLQKNQRYVIKLERNMILPVRIVIDTLSNLALPIYITPNGHKCHFKDVCISLSKCALVKQGILVSRDEDENDMLLSEWHTKFDSLKSQVRLEDQDSGSFWAGLFLARLISQMQLRHKYKTKKAECISEFNKRKEYSKMLRAKEEQDRIDAEIIELKQKANSHNMQDLDMAMRKKLMAYKQVKFRFDEANEKEEEDEEMFSLSYFMGNKQKPERMKTNVNLRSLNTNNPAGTRDVDRSTWWKDQRDSHSTANSLKHWIKINDIRYGIEEERERQKQKDKMRLAQQLKSENDQRRFEHVNRSIQIGPYSRLSGELTPVSSEQMRHQQLGTSESYHSSQPQRKESEVGAEMLTTDRPLLQFTTGTGAGAGGFGTSQNQTEEDQFNMIRKWGMNMPPRLEISNVYSGETSTLLKSDSKTSTFDGNQVELEEQKQIDTMPKLALLGADMMQREVSFNPRKSNSSNELEMFPNQKSRKGQAASDQSLRKSKTQNAIQVEFQNDGLLPRISEKTESHQSDLRIEDSHNGGSPNHESSQSKSNQSKKSKKSLPKDEMLSMQSAASIEETKVVVEANNPQPAKAPEIKTSEEALQQIAQRIGTAQFLQNKVLGVKVDFPKSQFNVAGPRQSEDLSSDYKSPAQTEQSMIDSASGGEESPHGGQVDAAQRRRSSYPEQHQSSERVPVSQFYKKNQISDDGSSESASCSASLTKSAETEGQPPQQEADTQARMYDNITSEMSKRETFISDSSGSLTGRKKKSFM